MENFTLNKTVWQTGLKKAIYTEIALFFKTENYAWEKFKGFISGIKPDL
jgi:hypothetical protein